MTSAVSPAREPEETLTGPWQRVGYLLASMAMVRAGFRHQQLADAKQSISQAGTDIELREAAENRLQELDLANAGREEITDRLVDALLWRGESSIASQALDRLSARFHSDYGVVIGLGEDAVQDTVSVPAGHAADVIQDQLTATVAWDREAAAVTAAAAIIDSRDSTDREAAAQALAEWHGPFPDPKRLTRDAAQGRRADLETRLAATGLGDTDRADLLFVVDYLTCTDRPPQVDLQRTRVWVDPGEEAKGRIRDLLSHFSADSRGEAMRRVMTDEIAVLTTDDKNAVRQAGTTIADDGTLEPMWPEYADRAQLSDQLSDYVRDTRDVIEFADWFATDPDAQIHLGAGSYDEIFDIVDRMRGERARLTAVADNGSGLVEIERAQLRAALRDLDIGVLLDSPKLLWADERSLRASDYSRGSDYARAIARLAEARIVSVLEQAEVADGGQASSTTAIASGLTKVRDAIYTTGADVFAEGPAQQESRNHRAAQVTDFGQTLRRAGASQRALSQIKAIIDTGIRNAESWNRTFRDRMQRWPVRTARAVASRDQRRAAIAAYATAAAQQQAAGDSVAARITNRRNAAPSEVSVAAARGPLTAPAATVAPARAPAGGVAATTPRGDLIHLSKPRQR